MSTHLGFSLRLHRLLAGDTARNFCWSPYSVASTLGLLADATSGRTHEEVVAALRPDGGSETGEHAKLLRSAAQQDGEEADERAVMAVANTLWADEQLPVEHSYTRALDQWPGSKVRQAPFRDAPEQARRAINADVADTTRELIPELIKSGMLDSETVATLVNALYLRVAWTEPFDEHATAPAPFHTPTGHVEAPTMKVRRSLGYARSGGWRAVTIPGARAVHATVLVPDDDIVTAEPVLNAELLEELLTTPTFQPVELYLPKFDVAGDAELNAPLGDLGMRTVFTPEADFSPLTPLPLRISAALHESVLRVDENGLEGAAATAAVMRLTAVLDEPEPITVRVDRPFLFVVHHADSGAVYFLARVVDPR